jgi:hypothetical protein
MNRNVSLVLALVAGLLFSSDLARAYGGGNGSAQHPYEIYTAEEMNSIGARPGDWDKHFILMADIDLSAYTGTQFNVIGTNSTPFTGTFDGNGHTISNFTYVSTGASDIGLFGVVSGAGARIEKLGLIDPDVSARTYVGSLVGKLSLGTVSDCYAQGDGSSVAGEYTGVGGLVGRLTAGTIENSHFSGQVSGHSYTGGLLGFNDRGAVSNSYSGGSVTGPVSSGEALGGLVGYNDSGTSQPATISSSHSGSSVWGSQNVGGLVGRNDCRLCSIEDSHATGDVFATHVSSARRAGGLVGWNHGTILNSYATGDVSGGTRGDQIGGLVGLLDAGTVERCYAMGTVAGDLEVGGLVGYSYQGLYATGSIITESYASGDVTGRDDVGGLVGYSANSNGTTSDCYASGAVSGATEIGGLVGRNWAGSIVNCYATGRASGGIAVGGLVGNFFDTVSSSFFDIQTGGPDNGIGTGLTTAEMQTRSTFTDAGWDFVAESANGTDDTWSMRDGIEYPELSWRRPLAVPVISELGMIVFPILLAGAALWVMRFGASWRRS